MEAQKFVELLASDRYRPTVPKKHVDLLLYDAMFMLATTQ